jgi:hypothetical protein
MEDKGNGRADDEAAAHAADEAVQVLLHEA